MTVCGAMGRVLSVALGCRCMRYPGWVVWLARVLVITVCATATAAVAAVGARLLGTFCT